MFASTKAGGTTMAFPNVCLTPAPPAPPVPIPYPSIGQLAQANSATCSKKVKFLNKAVLHVKSEIPKTNGDEAGTNKGVASGTQGDACKRTQGSMRVNVEGNPIVCMLQAVSSNGPSANAPSGSQLAPSQTKITVMS